MALRGWKLAVIAMLVLTPTAWLAVGLGKQSGRIASIRDAADLTLFMFEDSTTYAPGFTEGAFRAVHPGMSSAEVKRLLGNPIQVVELSGRGERVLRYTSGRSDANYWLRSVVVDSTGIVSEVLRGYFAD